MRRRRRLSPGCSGRRPLVGGRHRPIRRSKSDYIPFQLWLYPPETGMAALHPAADERLWRSILDRQTCRRASTVCHGPAEVSASVRRNFALKIAAGARMIPALGAIARSHSGAGRNSAANATSSQSQPVRSFPRANTSTPSFRRIGATAIKVSSTRFFVDAAYCDFAPGRLCTVGAIPPPGRPCPRDSIWISSGFRRDCRFSEDDLTSPGTMLFILALTGPADVVSN